MTIHRLLGKGLLVTGVSLAFALAGCGRKGDLEPPPGSNLPQKAAPAQQNDNSSFLPGGAVQKTPPIVPPKASFPLDPIL